MSHGSREWLDHVHHRWLDKVTNEIADDYVQLHTTAQGDPQKAGHGGEGTWLRFLADRLPPAYEIGTRKYIVPELGDESFETDLVVFSPGYPKRLRERDEVLGAGVAAAFSVKLRLDAAGIRDGVERAAKLRRAMNVRKGTPRSELLGAFAVGLLAHSHVWHRPESKPVENITRACHDLDRRLAIHPRECLDYLCVADLANWTRSRVPWLNLPPEASDQPRFYCWTTFIMTEPSPPPVASLLANLYARLAYSDAGLLPLAEGFGLTQSFAGTGDDVRLWDPAEVFSEYVLQELPTHAIERPDWQGSY
jgi:Domain of unknown function (DUF6602)